MNNGNLQSQPFSHTEAIHAYGVFMVAWAVLESVVQAAIMKYLVIDATKAVIVTGKLQFNPRVQLLRGLLKLHGDAHKETGKLLNSIEGFAQRNTLVHGNIIVGVPGELTFIKYDGGNSVKQSFTAESLLGHVTELNGRTETLQRLLQVTDEEVHQIGQATLALAS
ncbi:hypothetical protein [Cupriavidus sp. SS-3]|uniref:hypothetical protein n=1 Tax=Cupriavidus sp. SS-3 TaxID=3109596 RepID=UPI002DB6CFC9|nr:hypothetical protein [Cupriavidus sp. SS-3]MEC3767505.1 hypothetical protein [Cupriavidus sp. SS-3]